MACGSCLLVAGSAVSLLSSCGASNVLMTVEKEVKDFKIPLTAFNESSYQIVKHKKLKNILIRKDKTGVYHALSLKCPHMGGKVKPEGEGLRCTLHGSIFTIDGNVTKGPAKENLSVYETKIQGDYLVISINA